ncbi:MAG: PEGA domain-containing protein, partial [Myxococcota bacterium]
FAPGDTEKGESTMIFESDFADLENAPTQIGESVSEAKLSRIEQMQTGSLVVPAKPVGPPPKAAGPAGGGRVSVRPSQSINAGAVPSESGVPVGLLAAVGLVFIGLAGVLIYTLFSGGESTGTLMVTTEPVTENVEIVLDNEVIATTTPHYREGLKAGTYRLEARAAGYESKVFRVKIGDGAEAVVEVEFDTAVPRSDGLVRVGTDPPGASVYRGDDKVGITPFEVENVNTGKPVAFTVKLDGYRDVELKGEFGAGERMLELNASLEEENSSGTLFVTSRPTGAAVFLGKKKIGTTPYRIEDLDLEKKHSIELALDGFKSVKAVHEFNGKVDAKRSFTLERIREARPDGGRRPDAVKPAGGGKTPKPPGAGKPAKGGKCSGEGGTFSVLVVGESCSIKVGRKGGFTSPFFKQKVPTGKCPVVVSCPSGKSYSVTRTFKAGDNGKLIVMPNMLK